MRHTGMMTAALLALTLPAFTLPVAAQNDHLDANEMPTDHSTPAERAQTRALNEQIQAANRAIDAREAAARAQYDARRAAYDRQMADYHTAMQRDQTRRNAYHAARARYDAARARYDSEYGTWQRAAWPDNGHWAALTQDAKPVGGEVRFVDGTVAGTVTDTAPAANGAIAALELRLADGGLVWIDSADIRQSLASKALMTNLDRRDLLAMAGADAG